VSEHLSVLLILLYSFLFILHMLIGFVVVLRGNYAIKHVCCRLWISDYSVYNIGWYKEQSICSFGRKDKWCSFFI